MKISSAGVTVAGRVRQKNEDNFYINGVCKSDSSKDSYALEDNRPIADHVFAVCDGMGGYASGEVASLKALQILGQYDEGDGALDMEAYVAEANRMICETVPSSENEKVGTTLALMEICGGRASFCNVGDSRIYRMRDGHLQQISVDHTRAQSMIDAGFVSPEKARGMKESHILTQHLGIQESEFILCPKISREEEILPNDIYLLCSDGLTTMLEDDAIQQLIEVKKEAEAKMIAAELTVAALKKGGKDNITVIIVKAE